MRRIGVISDTHGCFDEPLREFLRDVDEIWHAGDFGSLELADEIAAFKPLPALALLERAQHLSAPARFAIFRSMNPMAFDVILSTREYEFILMISYKPF